MLLCEAVPEGPKAGVITNYIAGWHIKIDALATDCLLAVETAGLIND